MALGIGVGAIAAQGAMNIADTLAIGEVKRAEMLASGFANERVAGASAVKDLTGKQ